VSVALVITAGLVFLIGMAIQRGNTCTVVAIDDLVHRRSWHRIQAIAFIWFLVAGGLALSQLLTGRDPAPALVPVATWSVVGGLVLGTGAVINGACSTGTIAPRTPPAFTSLDYPVLSIFGMTVVLALTLRRLTAGPHESVRDFLRSAWDPRTATLIIAVLFVVAVHLAGPWSYTDMLGDLARGHTAHLLERSVLFVALLSGAVAAGRSMRGTRLVGPLKPRALRCTVGGLIMGLGFSIAPGAFEGDTLLGQPLLLGYAWAAMTASYLAIVIGLLYLHSRAGRRIGSLRPDPPVSPDRGTEQSADVQPGQPTG